MATPTIVDLFRKRALSDAQLQKEVANGLKRLLKSCVMDLIFKKALPATALALKNQINQINQQLWVKGGSPQAMIDELHALKATLSKQQKTVFEDLAKGCSAFVEVAAAPVATGTMGAMDQMQALRKFEDLAKPVEDKSEERNPDDARDPKKAMDQLRHLAGEILCAIAKLLADDLNTVLTRLKKQAQIKLDAFAERAAVPISAMLKGAKSLEVGQLAEQLPAVRGYIEALKKELCEDALRKRVTKGLMGAASKPLQGIGHGAQGTLALSVKFEQHLNKKLMKLKEVDESAQKLLRRNLPEGRLRARAFDVLLKTATKYEVRVDGFEGSFDMLKMAWQRSRIELNTDENQLVYLIEELKKLKDKESTAANWRDAAEGWISVLELRGQLRVQCGQAVLECMVADEKVLEALGAAKALMHIEGDTPPAALVTIIAQGPGAHIRKHGYRYMRRIDKELVLIRRIKELQMRAITGVGTLLVATSIAVGNYLARVMYDGVTNGFGSQSWLTWVLPLAVLVGLLVLCCFVGLAAYLCRKKKRPLYARISPKGVGAARRVGVAPSGTPGVPRALGATTDAYCA